MRRDIQARAVLILYLTVVAVCLHAQAATPPLQFDAASVRPNRRSECRGRWDFSASHGTVTAENAPLLRIISRAYHLTDDRVSGPSWLDSQCYDIRAKAAPETPDRDLMQMLQELLKDRFHLSAHLDPEERPIFALRVDKGGPKMYRDGDRITVPKTADDRVLFMARTLQDLCERLGRVTGRPVVDQTGLQGHFVIVLTYPRLAFATNAASDAPVDIFAAVRTQLGLRLESQRAAVDILKIETIDKVPTEN